MDTIDSETDAKPMTRRTLPDAERAGFVHALFGLHFPMMVEPTVFGMAGTLSPDYKGGFWEFHALSNGGFYMAPHSDTPFHAVCENGFEGALSADALGITACLYAYSNLSFMRIEDLAEVCARQYHLLRDFAMDHAEVKAILAAID